MILPRQKMLQDIASYFVRGWNAAVSRLRQLWVSDTVSKMRWKWAYAVSIVVLLGLAAIYFGKTPSNLYPAVTASVLWGSLTLLFCLVFMLGAAQTPQQFLIFFATGAFGAGTGYLVGAWLTPTGESNPLEQVHNIVAGVLTGVVGTKMLSLWDDLVDKPAGGTKPLILTGAYFTPIVLWLVGFTVSLSAFYTIRTTEAGDVRITYSPHENVRITGLNQLGILPDTIVHFSSAANSPEDVSTTWDFHLKEPCGSPIGDSKFDPAQFKTQMIDAFTAATGDLKTPSQPIIQSWINACPGSQNWVLTATSVQDRSRQSTLQVKFCRTKEDCPLEAPNSESKPGTTTTAPTSTSTGAGSAKRQGSTGATK